MVVSPIPLWQAWLLSQEHDDLQVQDVHLYRQMAATTTRGLAIMTPHLPIEIALDLMRCHKMITAGHHLGQTRHSCQPVDMLRINPEDEGRQARLKHMSCTTNATSTHSKTPINNTHTTINTTNVTTMMK